MFTKKKLLCLGLAALMVGGTVVHTSASSALLTQQAVSEESVSPYVYYYDENGELFYVATKADSEAQTAQMIDGFELPAGSFEVDESGTITALPTILATAINDDDYVVDALKWHKSDNQYRIVSSEAQMDGAYSAVPYLLRQEGAAVGSLYKWVDRSGDWGIPVYDTLPEATTEGQIVAVNGRKYQAVMKAVTDRYYTNAVSPDKVLLNKRLNSSGQILDAAGYVVILDVNIPAEVIERAHNGEVVTVSMAGLSVASAYPLSKLVYRNGTTVTSILSGSQIYEFTDSSEGVDPDVTAFNLYYTTTLKSQGQNAYNANCSKGNNFIISGGVSKSTIPDDYDLSSFIITFDETIGETTRDCIVWEDVGEYKTPVESHWTSTTTVMNVADSVENMDDAKKVYVLAEDGFSYFYRDYMNALLRLPNGEVRYYDDGVPTHARLVQDMDGNYYYVNRFLTAVRDCQYAISLAGGNGLLPAGRYTFDEEGKLVDPPVVIGDSDPQDLMNGLIRFSDGSIQYLSNGVPQHMGLVQDAEGRYYYINCTGFAVRGCTYSFGQDSSNKLLTGGTYVFSEEGYIVNLPTVIGDSDPTDIRNGLVRFSDGSVRFLVDSVPQRWGVVQDAEGNYYYVNSTTFAVRDCTYSFAAPWNNGLLPAGTYEVDENGHIQLPVLMGDQAGDKEEDYENGLMKLPNGDIVYLDDGKPLFAGLVQDKNGNYYYINETGTAVTDIYCEIKNTNGLLPEGGYTFDENGVMIDTTVPSFWENEIQITVNNVNAQLAAASGYTSSFVCANDMHVDVQQKQYAAYNVGKVANSIMNQTGIPYFVSMGDNNSQAALTSDDASTVYADIAKQDEFLSYIGWNRIVRILGNHDGVWGTRNGGYYTQSLTMEDKCDLILGRQQAAYEKAEVDVHYDEHDNRSWFFIDDDESKTRYIYLNSHWSEYTVDEYYIPTYNTFRGAQYGQQQLTWLAEDALDMEEGWGACVFVHVPPTPKHGAIVNGQAIGYIKDQHIMLGILNAYATQSAYSGNYNPSQAWSCVNISVDFTADGGNRPLGEICGVFSGHVHNDSIDNTTWPFPIITVLAAGNGPRDEEGQNYFAGRADAQGTDQETSFDVVVIDRETKTIYLNRVGEGEDRVTTYGN